jgi:hypothetical protein
MKKTVKIKNKNYKLLVNKIHKILQNYNLFLGI